MKGIFPLVPGAGIYYTAYYFLRDDRSLFLNKGVETLKIALALALGIALVCSLNRGRVTVPLLFHSVPLLFHCSTVPLPLLT